MKREDLTEKLLDIKREKGWTWKHIQEEIGGLSPILITAACLGQMKLPKAQARKAAALFGLSAVEERMLNEAPYRGSIAQMPPTDPLIYRFYELVMVYGTTWKELIQEEFGDGIMSAIDFNMTMEQHDDGARAQQQGRPGEARHVGQVPALQVLRQRGGRARIRLQGRLSGAGRCALRPRGAWDHT